MAKRKSGNGTSAYQDLYLQICLPYVFLWKIGVSKNAKERSKQITNELPGKWVCVAVIGIEFAYQIEQLLLALTIPFFWPFFGGKEIRWGPLWIVLVPVYWSLFILRYLLIMGFWLLLAYLFWAYHQP